jgi:hypothetical protein
VVKSPKKEDWMPACQSCSFFDIEPKEDLGYCRRYPPTLIHLGDDNFDSTFPIVARDDWCGEFHRFTN